MLFPGWSGIYIMERIQNFLLRKLFSKVLDKKTWQAYNEDAKKTWQNITGGILMNNREEILAKSRNENKGTDLFEKEIQTKAGIWGACVAAILATIFFTIQIVVGEGTNYGLFAVVFSINAAGYIFKAIRLKKRNDIVFSVIHVILALIFSYAHISGLIASSTIL